MSSSGGIGVPVKLLHECEGMIIGKHMHTT